MIEFELNPLIVFLVKKTICYQVCFDAYNLLVALGMGEDRAMSAVAMARAWSCDLATTEGGRVYALSAPGRVAIQSYARRPRTARVLAYVREPSRLRAGDEVGFVYSASGMAEVKYGR